MMVAVAACGGVPTEEGAGGGARSGAGDPYAAVFAELEGLEGEARTERLAELAQEEGEVNVYTSNTDLADQAELFTEEYGVEVNVYRAQAHTVLQRLLQEADAGFAGADLYDSNAEELATANQEELLREYEGPATEGLVEAADQEGWVGSRLNVFTVSWNTELVDQPPTSYQDLADDRFDDITMVEPRAFEWYMALSGYLTEQEGMTQEEVDQLFADIAAGSVQVVGNTEHAQHLASGEYGVSTSVYNHLVDELIDTGAPIARTPPVEPIVIRPNGVALLRTTQNPASALLLMEWLLTDAQQLLVEDFRIPVREEYQQGALEGLETIAVDVQQLVDEGSEWEQRYEEVLRDAQ